jgi:uncharacterized protein
LRRDVGDEKRYWSWIPANSTGKKTERHEARLLSLQQRITNDMRDAIKGADKNKLGVLRFIVGEFTHIPNEEFIKYPNKELPDEKVVSIIRKYIHNEQGLENPNSSAIEMLESYLPSSAPDEEVRAWIQENIDFSQFKSRMQAMKPIMTEFAGRIDGSNVKRILEEEME